MRVLTETTVKDLTQIESILLANIIRARYDAEGKSGYMLEHYNNSKLASEAALKSVTTMLNNMKMVAQA